MRETLRSTLRKAGVAALAAMLCGCSVGPDFEPPDPKLPQKSFFGRPEPAAPDPDRPPSLDAKWWRQFKDPTLSSLIDRVAEVNLDVRVATERLWESRAERNSAASALLPTVNSSAQYTRQLMSQNGLIALGSAFNQGKPLPYIPAFGLWQAGFDASWEIDLWGHVRRQVESAEAQVESAEFHARDTLVASIAELARDYAELRGAEAQLAILKANLASAEEILELTKTRAKGGLVTYLDVENASAQVESTRAQLPPLQSQESALIDAIGRLLDQPPQALRGELSHTGSLLFTPPHPPVGLASDLARRRPDIRRAEADLHAATANIGVAVAEFYPSFKFNGSVGASALDARKFFEGHSFQYQIGPSVTVPIFDAGRLKSQLELRDSQAREAAINYHKTVLAAWTEVVDALVAYRAEEARHARLKAQAAHEREALSLARARYRTGVSPFINVLDAQRSTLQAELQAVQSRTTVATNFVTLYKALGGGWEEALP